jgi:hypothetical protein
LPDLAKLLFYDLKMSDQMLPSSAAIIANYKQDKQEFNNKHENFHLNIWQ